MVFKVVAPDTVNEVTVVPANVVELVTVKLYRLVDPVVVKFTVVSVDSVLVPCTFIPFPIYTIPETPRPPFNVTHPDEVDVLAVLEDTEIEDRVQDPVDEIVLKLLVPVTVNELTVVPAKEVVPVAVSADTLVVPDTVNAVAVVVFNVEVPVAESVVIFAVGAVRVVIVAVDNVLFPET